MAETVKLLPCPHCGEANELYPAYRDMGYGKPYAIDCLGCGADFTPREGFDVIALWNRRAPASVKPLEFEDFQPEAPTNNGRTGNRIAERALTPFGAYFLEHSKDDDSWSVTAGLVGPAILGPFTEAWQARKAIDEHYEDRIRAALGGVA